MKALTIILLAIRISGSPSPAGGIVSEQALSCATVALASWELYEWNGLAPAGVSAGDTQDGEACAESSSLLPVEGLPEVLP